MSTILLTLCLVLAAQGAPASSQEPSAEPPAQTAPVESPFEKLNREYEAARSEWLHAIETAEDSKSRRSLRKARPEITFRPQFNALSEVGADESRGRSLLWLVQHAFDFGLKRSESKVVKLAWIEKLVAEHADKRWFADALDPLDEAAELIGLERYAELALIIVEKTPDDAVAAYALWQAGNSHLASRAKNDKGEPLHREKGLVLLERLLRDYPEDRIAKFAAGRVYSEKYLQVGMICPDFEAKTVDGTSFKLSDFRGKVTLVKFWGFW